MTNNKVRLIDYERTHEEDKNNLWMNSGKLPRHEFKELKREYAVDLKNFVKQATLNNALSGVNFEKHYQSKETFVILGLWTQCLQFQNQLSLNQILQIIEMMFEYLTPIYQKVLLNKVITYFDFIDHDTQLRLDNIIANLMKNADYSEKEYHDLYSFISSYVGADIYGENALKKKEKFVANPIIEDRFLEEEEDLKYIQDNEFITAYRGFIAKDDEPIRLFDKAGMKEFQQRNINNAKTEADVETLKMVSSRMYYTQNSGYGRSFTLSKFTAHYFAFFAEYVLKQSASFKESKFRTVVGKYKIHKSEIFVYTNERHEREVMLKKFGKDKVFNMKNAPLVMLDRYEFFTDTNGKFDKTGGYKQGCNLRPKPNDHNYAKDRKIMKVFTERKVA